MPILFSVSVLCVVAAIAAPLAASLIDAGRGRPQ
jgi:hypothetical protein